VRWNKNLFSISEWRAIGNTNLNTTDKGGEVKKAKTKKIHRRDAEGAEKSQK
jgi:hypothetical protein